MKHYGTKEWKREYMRTYREANKEKIAKRSKAYQEANKEKIKEYQKAYREAKKRLTSSKKSAELKP